MRYKLISFIIGLIIGCGILYAILLLNENDTNKKIESTQTITITKHDSIVEASIINIIINEIKRREGYSEKVYSFGKHYYIGYGHQIDFENEPYAVTTTMSKEEATFVLREDYFKYVEIVEKLYSIQDNRKYIIASIGYTVGIGKLYNSTLSTYILTNASDSLIVNEILKFDKIKVDLGLIQSSNLKYTRELEKELYLMCHDSSL